MSIWLDIFNHLGFRYLTRSKTDNRAVLIVIVLTAIHDISAISIFQKKSIYAVVDLEMFRPLRCFRQIDNTYQWVSCFESEKFVVFIYLIKFNNLFHNPFFYILYRKYNSFYLNYRWLYYRIEDLGTNISKSYTSPLILLQ